MLAGANWRQHFIEDLGNLVFDRGTPRAVVRVLGQMVVCDSPEQTVWDIQEELTLSAGIVSAAVRTLVNSGMLERVPRRSERLISCRLHPKCWGKPLESRYRTLVQLRQVADRALVSSEGEADQQFVEIHDGYAGSEAQLGVLLEDAKAPR
jgi:hypothetical protein